MNHIRIVALVIVAAVVWSGGTWRADAGSHPASQPADTFAARLDAEMPELLARYDVPGTVVARISNGAVAWTRAYGVANVATGEPMRPDMVFEFGSIGKILTAWATMRLVEQGQIDLDAPANRYLKRWQIESSEYDADQVTIRRLLSHSSGLSIHGYLDYSPRRASLPDLVESIAGAHLLEGVTETLQTGRLSRGNVALVQEPGTGYKYSGGGYAVLQMIVEDISGEPFAQFVQREITDPLGATSLRWAWTPELAANAPVAYGDEGQPLERRQLSIHGIGSEIGTVTDLAKFVAATVTGPNDEPRGRGVLSEKAVTSMIMPQPGTGSVHGLGYGLGMLNGARSVSHGGQNSGWIAFFILDTFRRDGFVVASSSNRATPLQSTITNLWLDTTYGPAPRTDWAPAAALGTMALLPLSVAAILAAALVVAAVRLVRQVRRGRRLRRARPEGRGLWGGLPWLLWLLFLVYTVYSPLPLYLPGGWPDFWPTPGSHALLVVLAAWVVYTGVAALYTAGAQEG